MAGAGSGEVEVEVAAEVVEGAESRKTLSSLERRADGQDVRLVVARTSGRRSQDGTQEREQEESDHEARP